MKHIAKWSLITSNNVIYITLRFAALSFSPHHSLSQTHTLRTVCRMTDMN